MKVICDACKREFEMTQDKLQEKYLGAMITEIFYHCPKCDKKYLVGIMNTKCRKLKRSLELEIKKKFAITNSIEAIVQDNKIDNIQKKLREEMNRINGKA